MVSGEKLKQRLYKEFQKGQGRLTCDREVSFVCLDEAAMETMKKGFMSTCLQEVGLWLRYCPLSLLSVARVGPHSPCLDQLRYLFI
ncbi:hypothetical protein F5B17DRAFT_390854 [Nemania serpens]|nr:hypothetical protein F5B17DRAFT_390854 [Nemania serpens]